MGCSNSKEIALQELKNIIAGQVTENEQLHADLEKIKATAKPGTTVGKPPTAEHIKILLLAYEKNLKSLNELAQGFYESSKQNCLASNTVDEIIELCQDLNNKVEKLEKMILDKEKLKQEENRLELHIAELEEEVKEMEKQRFFSEESRNQHHLLHEKVSGLQTKKQEIIEEIEGYEKEIEDLNQEIKVSGLDDKGNSKDLSNYEILLKMSDLEVNLELKKIDQDLEILSNEMRELKQRELELQSMEALVNSRSASRNSNQELVPFQIKRSRERMDTLEGDQAKLKEELNLFKRNSLAEKLKDEKIEAFKDLALKKSIKEEEEGKSTFEKIGDKLQGSFNRALTKGVSIKNS